MASDATRHAGLQFMLCLCTGCIRGEDDSTEYYTVLGLSPGATQAEIRRAWRKVSLRLHPDKLAQRGKSVGPKEMRSQMTRMNTKGFKDKMIAGSFTRERHISRASCS